MASWREEYILALQERDQRLKIHYDLVDAYTRLADRTAALEAEKVVQASSSAVTTSAKSPSPTALGGEGSAQLKSDLAEALRAKGQLQLRLKLADEELEKLRYKYNGDSKVLKSLAVERLVLVTKVRDRDEELKGKTKLVEEVQDEMLSLNLQLNLAEQRSKKLQQENKDLVDRWMARMGQEADAMNTASNF